MAKYHGIKKVCTDSKGYCTGFYSPNYLQLFYDMKDDKCWTVPHCSLGHNSWASYESKNILDCGFIVSPMTMLEIASRIQNTYNEFELYTKGGDLFESKA